MLQGITDRVVDWEEPSAGTRHEETFTLALAPLLGSHVLLRNTP